MSHQIVRRRSRVRGIGTLLLAGGLTLTACSTSKTSVDSSPGVTKDKITLGVLTDITGPFKAIDEQQNLGVKLYWDEKNRTGDTCGRKVEIATRDHGYDPQKALSLAGELNKDVLAYQVTVGSPPTSAVLPELEEQKIIGVAMSWSPVLGASDALIIPGTYYSVEMVGALDYLVEQGTVKSGDSVGHIYFAGDYGEPAFEGLKHSAGKNGVKVVGSQIDPSVTDVTSQVAALQAKKVKAIFINASPTQLASLASLTESKGLDVPIISSAPAFAPQLLETNAAKILEKRALVVSSVIPFSGDTPAAKKVAELYGKSGSKVPASMWVVLGYAASSIMDQAITAACEDDQVSREGLWDSYQKLGKVDTDGATVALDFSSNGETPSRSINVLRPSTSVKGGLDPVTEGFVGKNTEGYGSK
ncbi:MULTISPECIES: ABC transporter substrate-binding protein [unclassified Streptomyces]|uniref:ABC transporter substrate-binding protein n=1 Tax=unclassified Streptomyces TaxID=2593676 RepID=UPI0013702EC6|nr:MULTISPECIES: ABC transporter substrate-binding protein [unclassified Streptomyces]MCW5253518.1 ABC transporter substrate-binding protein [Streptomyces sp. SHP 1-2]MYU24078.1 ABC transporter substrate-binding protein [Streptomyces sp. SID8352]